MAGPFFAARSAAAHPPSSTAPRVQSLPSRSSVGHRRFANPVAWPGEMQSGNHLQGASRQMDLSWADHRRCSHASLHGRFLQDGVQRRRTGAQDLPTCRRGKGPDAHSRSGSCEGQVLRPRTHIGLERPLGRGRPTAGADKKLIPHRPAAGDLPAGMMRLAVGGIDRTANQPVAQGQSRRGSLG